MGETQKQPPELFYKKSVLENFAKSTGKHLCQSLQLGQFAAFLDTTGTPVTKLFESLVNFGEIQSQKILLPEVTKPAKLLLVPPAINATRERLF